jgi:hypothetical protein
MMALTIQNPFYLRLGDLEAIHQRIRLKVHLNPSKVVIVDKDHVTAVRLLCSPC